ncbi:DUF1385 domain-containing protein, partial [Armatimonas sp.]|uniref:DUF1385 domain-containing protein n=1 Tax=Armatimonas sp. TaxID=1872638 RepID=UPI00286BD754
MTTEKLLQDTHKVGQIMRTVDFVDTFDSLAQASVRMHENFSDLLPVVQGGKFVGVLTEKSLARAISGGMLWTAAVSDAMIDAPTIRSDAPQDEALAMLTSQPFSAITVVDHNHEVLGIIAASCFSPTALTENRPMMVGGMATPFGVYLTNGAIGAGAQGFSLVLTGFVLYVLIFASQFASRQIEEAVINQMTEQYRQVIFGFLPTVLFFGLMRFIPLSGTHGAEHQVVHAIERGEPLVPEVVTRMPRVHPRCGTNVAVGASLFLTITQIKWVASDEIRLAVGLIIWA